MIMIEIDETLPIVKAADTAKMAWAKANRKNGESLSLFAARLNVSTRTAMRWINGEKRNCKTPIMDHSLDKCLFCNDVNHLQLHHVKGRKHGDETIALCRQCHIKFHVLDSNYLTPKGTT